MDDPYREVGMETSRAVAADPESPEIRAAKWWHENGRQIDPDSHCDDWEIKRRELAQIAFIAGFKAAKSR